MLTQIKRWPQCLREMNRVTYSLLHRPIYIPTNQKRVTSKERKTIWSEPGGTQVSEPLQQAMKRYATFWPRNESCNRSPISWANVHSQCGQSVWNETGIAGVMKPAHIWASLVRGMATTICLLNRYHQRCKCLWSGVSIRPEQLLSACAGIPPRSINVVVLSPGPFHIVQQ